MSLGISFQGGGSKGISIDAASKKRFEEFFRNEYGNARKLCLYLTNHSILDASYADDILQEAFIVCLSNISYVLSHPNPRAWLYKTIRNVFYNFTRRIKKQYEANEQYDDNKRLYDTTYVDVLNSIDIQHAITKALNRLSHDEYTLFLDFYVQKKSRSEICVKYAVKYDALQKRILRLTQRIRKLLSEESNYANLFR